MANPSRSSAARTGKGARRGASEVPYPELFQPIQIGKCKIDNRIVMAPMNVLMSSGNTGLVNDQILAYYAARARGGTGLLISECVLGTRLASRFPYTTNLHLFNTTHLAGLEELSETVHAFGSSRSIERRSHAVSQKLCDASSSARDASTATRRAAGAPGSAASRRSVRCSASTGRPAARCARAASRRVSAPAAATTSAATEDAGTA